MTKFRATHDDKRACVLLTYHPTQAKLTRDKFCARMEYELTKVKRHSIENFICAEEYGAGSAKHFHMAIEFSKNVHIPTLIEHFRSKNMNIDVESDAHDYMTYFRYLYVPSEKKFKTDLDPKPKLSYPHAIPSALVSKRNGKQRLDFKFFLDLVTANSLKSCEDFFKFTSSLKSDQQAALYEFTRSRKIVDIQSDLDQIWQFVTGVTNKAQCRFELMNASYFSLCKCDGDVTDMIESILRNNSIPFSDFAAACFESLKHGAGKHRNVCIVGDSNRGKTTLLSSLEDVFGMENVFTTPVSTSTFPLIHLNKKCLVLMNDFYLPCNKLSLSDIFVWWEGLSFIIGLPKNAALDDILYTQASPIFVTTAAPLVVGTGTLIDSKKTEMVQNRLRTFTLTKEIKSPKGKIPKCGHCFLRFCNKHAPGYFDWKKPAGAPLPIRKPYDMKKCMYQSIKKARAASEAPAAKKSRRS